MIFFGAESGSDWVLEEMQKGITTQQTLEIARRTRQFNIIPEFSFVVGNPSDPDRDTKETLRFIPPDKAYRSRFRDHHSALDTPTPQPHAAGGEMYGKIDAQIAFPDTPAGWAAKEWMNFTLRIEYRMHPGLAKDQKTHRQLRDRSGSRRPTVQDIRARPMESHASENTQCMALHSSYLQLPF